MTSVNKKNRARGTDPKNLAEEIFGHAMRAAPTPVIVTTTDRKIIAANSAAEQLFGHADGEMAALSARQLYANEYEWSLTASALATSPCPTVAVTLLRQSGELFDASVAITSINGAGQYQTIYMETITPICTSSSRADDDVVGLRMHDAVRLARGIAHDFNNLLAIITGNVQLAQQDARAPARSRYLREAEYACTAASRLTHRLMEFARDRRMSPIAIDLADALATQLPLLRRAIGQMHTLDFIIAPNVRRAFADPSGLENAVLNIVLNARDAMPSGGTIVIACKNTGLADDHATVLDNVALASTITIAISDSGTGMTPRVKARAFDPFFSTKDPRRGTGLGLATVLGFAQQSGGSATIDTTLGAGTTVSIILPACD